MTDEPETLFLAARHMIEAIDRGYFTDSFLPQSAFTNALREAVAREGRNADHRAVRTVSGRVG